MKSEFAWISLLTERFESLSPKRMHSELLHSDSLAIGDDAAVLTASPDAMICTVDAAVEKVHFRRDWMTLAQIAARAVHAALSDVASMGGRVNHPSAGVLFSLGIPSSFSESEFAELIDGLATVCALTRTAILGGNLTRNPVLSISTTVLGRVLRKPVLRSGARASHNVFVTGPIGASVLGLKSLIQKREHDPLFLPFIQHFISPIARLDVSESMAAVASACIDLSDGLLQDAAHLGRASGVAVVIESERVPMLDHSEEVASELACELLQTALTGGEDYELLFTSESTELSFATRIGHVEPGEGVWLERASERTRMDTDSSMNGWDHFRARKTDSADSARE